MIETSIYLTDKYNEFKMVTFHKNNITAFKKLVGKSLVGYNTPNRVNGVHSCHIDTQDGIRRICEYDKVVKDKDGNFYIYEQNTEIEITITIGFDELNDIVAVETPIDIRELPSKGQKWHHFKGDIYVITDIAKHTETGNDLVIYTNTDDIVYARPLDMFMTEVDHSKYPNVKQKYRFELCL